MDITIDYDSFVDYINLKWVLACVAVIKQVRFALRLEFDMNFVYWYLYACVKGYNTGFPQKSLTILKIYYENLKSVIQIFFFILISFD